MAKSRTDCLTVTDVKNKLRDVANKRKNLNDKHKIFIDAYVEEALDLEIFEAGLRALCPHRYENSICIHCGTKSN